MRNYMKSPMAVKPVLSPMHTQYVPDPPPGGRSATIVITSGPSETSEGDVSMATGAMDAPPDVLDDPEDVRMPADADTADLAEPPMVEEQQPPKPVAKAAPKRRAAKPRKPKAKTTKETKPKKKSD